MEEAGRGYGSGVDRVSRARPASSVAKKMCTKLTTIPGPAFDGRDRMFVLEMSTAHGRPFPPTSGYRADRPVGAGRRSCPN